jgi:hypothetical protein
MVNRRFLVVFSFLFVLMFVLLFVFDLSSFLPITSCVTETTLARRRTVDLSAPNRWRRNLDIGQGFRNYVRFYLTTN